VSNALKFTSSNGTVKVSATVQHKSKLLAVETSNSLISKELWKTSVHPTNENVLEDDLLFVLTVKDSGAGISKVLYYVLDALRLLLLIMCRRIRRSSSWASSSSTRENFRQDRALDWVSSVSRIEYINS